MKMRLLAALLGLGLAGTGPLAAQAWDAPSFQPPGQADDLGVYLVDPDVNDFGIMAIWRQSGPINLGVRGGIFAFDDPAFAVGAEASDMLMTATDAIPVDAAWTLGVGATFINGTFLRVPAGITVGRRFSAGEWAFLPYIHPRLGLDLFVDDGESETELGFTTDIGADFYAGRFIARIGVSVGDWDAIGAGIAIRTGRGVEVASP